MRLSTERRAAPRMAVERPCRLRRAAAGRMDVARTVNVSESGCLVEVRTPRLLVEGEQVSVGVSWEGGAVVPSGSLVPARVVRTSIADGAQRVGLCFEPTVAAVRAA